EEKPRARGRPAAHPARRRPSGREQPAGEEMAGRPVREGQSRKCGCLARGGHPPDDREAGRHGRRQGAEAAAGPAEARSRRLRLHVQEGHGELHRLFNAGAHGQAVPGGGQQDSDPGGAAGAPQRRPAHPGHRDPSDHRWRRRPVGGRLRPLRRAARG
ncbi:unnamed protein product, partial [Prorocentrum cordatum]